MRKLNFNNNNENLAIKLNDCMVKNGREFIVNLRYKSGDDGITVNNLISEQSSILNCVKFSQEKICRKALEKGEELIDLCLKIS